jgi:hypothetical protein
MGAVHIVIGRTLGLCVAKAAAAIAGVQNLGLEGQTCFSVAAQKT